MSEADHDRYHAAMHAVQSGVATEHAIGSRDGESRPARLLRKGGAS